MDTPAVLPVKLQSSNLRPIAYRVLSKKHGLNVQTDALKLLTETIGLRFGSDWKGPQSQLFLEDIARIWKSQDRGLFIDGVGLKQVINEAISSSIGGSKSKSLKDISIDSFAPKAATRTDTIVDVDGMDVDTPTPPPPATSNSNSTFQWEDYFRVIGADNQPKYQFDKVRKQFSLVRDQQPATTSNLQHHFLHLRETLNAKVDNFSSRYNLISDRLSRNENFQKPTFSSMSSFSRGNHHKNLHHEITLIKNLLGRDGQSFILFGLLSQNSNGDYTLEDSTDIIELNISQALKAEGSYYCSGMFVVAEGIYSATGGASSSATNVVGGCFHVSNIGHPPAEKRDVSMENYGNLDFMGVHESDHLDTNNHILRVDKQLKRHLVHLERQLTHHKLIFMGSDCFLDNMKTMQGLKAFFIKMEKSLIEENEETEDELPLALVFSGSFTSMPLIPTNTSSTNIPISASYKNYFDDLATLIGKFPTIISKVKFVFIPGANDPWQSTFSLGSSSTQVWPQQPISPIFTSRIARILPKGHLICGWNPVRINYLSQEIVIMRDDITQKLKRNDIIFPTDISIEEELLKKENARGSSRLEVEEILERPHVAEKVKQARKVVKTILDQGQLQPFKLDMRVIRPYYDHILRLEPLPSILILSDSSSGPFEVTYNGCKVINVGRLIGTTKRLNYVEYHPSSKKCNFKEIYF
ncbi:DNA polymerase epsilon subunit B [[Candida] anglica]